MNSHIDFSGLPRLPVNLAVVIDKSGSMNDDNKMTFVKDGLRLMLQSLGPQDRLAIITYDSRARVLMPSTPVKDRKTIAAIINSIYPGGATNIHDGLTTGYEQLLTHYDDAKVNRLMLLSDGVPTTGPTDPEAILAAAHAFDDHNIGISTIGVGTDFNHPLMLQLAQQGGGNFYFLRDYNRITTVFRDELETALTPIAQDVELTISFEDEISLVASHGLPMGLSDEGDPHIIIPTMYLSRRNGIMLLELDLGDLLDLNGERPVGTATLEYTLLTTGHRETATYPITLPRIAHQGRETTFFEHPAIRRNFDLLMAIYSLQDTCDAFHHHDLSAARGFAHNLVAFLDAESRDLEDSALARELDTARRLLSLIR